MARRAAASCLRTEAWKGDVPDGITEVVRVESNFLKLMGRVMATGVEDEKKALTYVDDWNIRTLSEFLGQAGPKPKVRKFVPPRATPGSSA